MKPKILVLTPTLGLRSTLRDTIKTIEVIGGENVKHILITPENNVEDLQLQYPSLEILAEPKDGKKGIYPALNYGFKVFAKDYEYITFLNDDDYWLPGFSKMIDHVLNNRNIDFVYGKVQFIGEDGSFLKKQACSNQFYQFLSLFHSGIVLFTQQATIIKSDLYFKLGGFSEDYKLISDSKLWIDLSEIKPQYKYFPVECAAYRIQTGQLSSNKNLQKEEHFRLLKSYPIPNRFKKAIDKCVFRILNLKVYINRL